MLDAKLLAKFSLQFFHFWTMVVTFEVNATMNKKEDKEIIIRAVKFPSHLSGLAFTNKNLTGIF